MNLDNNEAEAVSNFKDKLVDLCRDHIRSITLFGSKARGETNPQSDIDLLVVVDKESIQLWEEIQSISSAISLDHNVFLSAKVMDVEHLKFLEKVESSFIKNIHRDGADIWKAA